MKIKDEYLKLIENNKYDFTDYENITDFINSYIYDDNTLDDIEDCVHEYADGSVSVYYHQIVKDWQENADCQQLTVEVCGEYAENDIYKMMQSDLYFFTEQKTREDFEKLKELAEE